MIVRHRPRDSSHSHKNGRSTAEMATTTATSRKIYLLLTFLALISSSILVVADDNSQKEAHDNDNENPNKKEKKFAIATLLTTREYIPGALVLAESLNAVGAKGDRVLLWVGPEDDPRSDLSADDLNRLQDYWPITIQLSKANNTYTECQLSDQHRAAIAANPDKLGGLERYWGTCSKFALWTLTQYDVVVYLDADSFALQNFDFCFDYLEDGKAAFAAHGVPESWDTDPPTWGNFYTAMMVLKPLHNVQTYFHTLANQQYLAEGEITLLNQVIQQWKPLPRFTLVAQTEFVRPTDGAGQIDWSQAKAYDFAGSPETKPWISHHQGKLKQNENWHAYFGSMQPGTPAFDRYMYPQRIWNQYYDKILEREARSSNGSSKKISKDDEL